MDGFKILGTSNDVTECEVCGKVELKGTVALIALDDDGNEDGEAFYAGTTCAARKVGVKSADIRGAVKAYNTRLQIARCNFPDYFRNMFGTSVEAHIRKFPNGRAQCEDLYKRYMRREGFAV
jgi:hypothetical protein